RTPPRRPPPPPLFPYTTLFRSEIGRNLRLGSRIGRIRHGEQLPVPLPTDGAPRRPACVDGFGADSTPAHRCGPRDAACTPTASRSEEHTSELQSRENLVCRLLL